MKRVIGFLVFLAAAAISPTVLHAQTDYKHPHLDDSGHVLDSTGTTLGWIKDGVIFNSHGEKVGKIEKEHLYDYKGHRLGRIGKDGTFYDENDAVVFTIETTNQGEKCKVFDPQGKVIATVHENYKNQACAMHCLSKNMP